MTNMLRQTLVLLIHLGQLLEPWEASIAYPFPSLTILRKGASGYTVHFHSLSILRVPQSTWDKVVERGGVGNSSVDLLLRNLARLAKVLLLD